MVARMRPGFPAATAENIARREKLFARLDLAQLDELVTYKDMSAACGCDVQDPSHRHILQSTLNKVRRESGKHFVNVLGVGYKWVIKTGVHQDLKRDARSRVRSVRRSIRKLACAGDYNEMSPEEQRVHLGEQSRLALELHVHSKKSIRRIEDVAHIKQQELAYKESLRALLTMQENGNGDSKTEE